VKKLPKIKPILHGLTGALILFLLLLLVGILTGGSKIIIIQSPFLIRDKTLSPVDEQWLKEEILKHRIEEEIDRAIKDKKQSKGVLAPASGAFAREATSGHLVVGNDTKSKIRAVFGADGKMAIKVAFCESSLNPFATHKNSSAKGLFQIIDPTFKQFSCAGDPFNPDDNIRCAKKIFDKFGWGSSGSWLASKRCWGAK